MRHRTEPSHEAQNETPNLLSSLSKPNRVQLDDVRVLFEDDLGRNIAAYFNSLLEQVYYGQIVQMAHPQ